jgi:hypothetical protein
LRSALRSPQRSNKNNLSTMWAKKRRCCAAAWLQHHSDVEVAPCGDLLCAAFQSFATTASAGAQRSRKPLMRRVKDGGALSVAKATP